MKTFHSTILNLILEKSNIDFKFNVLYKFWTQDLAKKYEIMTTNMINRLK